MYPPVIAAINLNLEVGTQQFVKGPRVIGAKNLLSN